MTPERSDRRVDPDLAHALSHRFVAAPVDYDTVRRLHAGDVGGWVALASRIAAPAPERLAELDARWRSDPRELFEILLTDADAVTIRRCRAAWASMDRFSPFGLGAG